MADLKRASGADAADLQALFTRTFLEAYEGVHSPENLSRYCANHYSLEAARAVIADPGADCVIARQNGEAAGFFVVKDHECPLRALEGGAAELKQIYVLKAHYGAGLGEALYKGALDAIRARGRRWLWLVVSDLNLRARKFYEKNGLEAVGAGPELVVGTDRLSSTILAGRL